MTTSPAMTVPRAVATRHPAPFAVIPATDRAAVPGAGADAERPPLQHDRRDPMLRQFERRREPGIAAADNRHPRLPRHLDELPGRRRIRLPPIRPGLKLGVKDAAACH